MPKLVARYCPIGCHLAPRYLAAQRMYTSENSRELEPVSAPGWTVNPSVTPTQARILPTRWLCGGLRWSDVVLFVPGWVSSTVGGDMNVVEVVGGFGAHLRHPLALVGAQIDGVPPDHVV